MSSPLEPLITAGPKNGKIKQVIHLLRNTKSNPGDLLVLEGLWAIEKALSLNVCFDSFFFCPELAFTSEAKQVIASFRRIAPSFSVSKKTFLSMSERGQPDGLLSVVRLKSYALEEISPQEKSLVIVLDGLEIPGNIGTIVRSADGCGAQAVMITNRRARKTHPKMVKGSQGAIFSIPILELSIEDVLSWSSKHNYQIILADSRSQMAYDRFPYRNRVALVIGSERYGVSPNWYEHTHERVSIPMSGNCDSLNVAVAGSILMYQVSRYHTTH